MHVTVRDVDFPENVSIGVVHNLSQLILLSDNARHFPTKTPKLTKACSKNGLSRTSKTDKGSLRIEKASYVVSSIAI